MARVTYLLQVALRVAVRIPRVAIRPPVEVVEPRSLEDAVLAVS